MHGNSVQLHGKLVAMFLSLSFQVRTKTMDS